MPREAPYTIRRESVAMERTLADVRMVLWYATAIVTSRLHEDSAHSRFWLTSCLSFFLAYTIAMLLTTHYFQRFIRVAAVLSSFLEVGLITLLVWASYAPLSPFYLWYVFYVISISLRYGLQVSIIGLAASIVLYTVVSIQSGDIYLPMFLGYTVFLFVLAFLFGIISERQRSYQTRLAAVNELGVALVSLSTSKEIIRLLVSQTAELIRADRCWFAGFRGENSEATPTIAVGASPEEVDELVKNLGEWSPAMILEKNQVVVTNKPRNDASVPAEALKVIQFKSLAAVPLYVRDAPVGVLYASDKMPHGFSGYDVELLDLISAQSAPIIENIQLWERLQEAAAGEERLRIARDLHDNFLQTLSAIKLYLERTRLLIDKDSEKAKASVERLHEISTEGLADVRSYLSQLRLMGPEPSRFGQAAEQSAVQAARRGGFVIHTDIDIPEDAFDRELSLAAFQILRELLNNAVKHADATNVWVMARFEDGSLKMEVRDDGVGFNLEEGRKASEKGHLGLVGIEERVGELDGKVEFFSSPGDGTRVEVVLPTKANSDPED